MLASDVARERRFRAGSGTARDCRFRGGLRYGDRLQIYGRPAMWRENADVGAPADVAKVNVCDLVKHQKYGKNKHQKCEK